MPVAGGDVRNQPGESPEGEQRLIDESRVEQQGSPRAWNETTVLAD